MNRIAAGIFLVAAFFSGSLPLSVWIGRIAIGADIRDYGDGNPGATNVFRAGGRRLGLVAVLADYGKGLIPVALVMLLTGARFPFRLCLALSPVLGHAFSPFLRFRGGKAVAVTFGVWTALTGWLGPTVLGLSLGTAVKATGANGWAVLTAMLALGLAILSLPSKFFLFGADNQRRWLLTTLGGNFLILAWKHRKDLDTPPQFLAGSK